MEKRINELNDRKLEIIQPEQQKENRLKKNSKASQDCGIITKGLTFMSLRSQKEKGKKVELKTYSEISFWSGNVPNLTKKKRHKT